MEKLVGIFALGITMSLVSGKYVETIAQVSIEGGKLLYVPVKRGLIQEKLDAVPGPTLYMPPGPVLPNQPEGTHPLLVDIADLTLWSVVDDGFPLGIEITISIPFLAATPGGPTDYVLGLIVLYDGHDHGANFPHPNFLYEYWPVHQIILDPSADLVTVEDGVSRMLIEFGTQDSCDGVSNDEAPTYMFTKQGYPDFNYCIFYNAGAKQYCENVNDYDTIMGIFDSEPNVCHVWKTVAEKNCEPRHAGILRVTGKFKDMIPIDRSVRATSALQYSGDYNIGVKFPCVY